MGAGSASRIRDASPPPPPLVRSFTFLSHFANISEDVAIVGGGNAGAGDSPRRLVPPAAAARGTAADAIAKIASAGVSQAAVESWFRGAVVSPVLTAHPTEVKRKSVMEFEREVFLLLQQHQSLPADSAAGGPIEARIYVLVLTLWQTALLRLSKLSVADEIDNGLVGYRRTFLRWVLRSLLPQPPAAGALNTPRSPQRRAAALRGPRGRAAHRGCRGPFVRAAALPSDGLVDRGRPRRQPIRQRGDAHVRRQAPVCARARALPRGVHGEAAGSPW